jgi:hypothetical protein
MCGVELRHNGKVFCDPCLRIRRNEDQRQRYHDKCQFCFTVLHKFRSKYCSSICELSSRSKLDRRDCKICFTHKIVGVKPLCDGDCNRIYHTLMKQISRSRIELHEM